MQLPITLEFDHVVKRVVQALHDYGEDHADTNHIHRYFNDDDGSPACLVGVVLAAEGVEYEDLGSLNRVAITELKSDDILDEDLDEKTENFLYQLQVCNDAGRFWIDAFSVALEEVGESLESIGYREAGK